MGHIKQIVTAVVATMVLVSQVEAQAEGGPAGDPLMGLLPIILLFVVFYFLLIRPQAKRAKEHKKMVAELAKDDEVVTNGGLLGRITDVGEPDDPFVVLEITDGIRVRVQRNAVSQQMPKGTIEKA